MELSVSELAARCQTTVARVNWALVSRGIRPSRLVGNTRLYGPSEVAAPRRHYVRRAHGAAGGSVEVPSDRRGSRLSLAAEHRAREIRP